MRAVQKALLRDGRTDIAEPRIETVLLAVGIEGHLVQPVGERAQEGYAVQARVVAQSGGRGMFMLITFLP